MLLSNNETRIVNFTRKTNQKITCNSRHYFRAINQKGKENVQNLLSDHQKLKGRGYASKDMGSDLVKNFRIKDSPSLSSINSILENKRPEFIIKLSH